MLRLTGTMILKIALESFAHKDSKATLGSIKVVA